MYRKLSPDDRVVILKALCELRLDVRDWLNGQYKLHALHACSRPFTNHLFSFCSHYSCMYPKLTLHSCCDAISFWLILCFSIYVNRKLWTCCEFLLVCILFTSHFFGNQTAKVFLLTYFVCVEKVPDGSGASANSYVKHAYYWNHIHFTYTQCVVNQYLT
jgi:hypothetical protein